MSTDEVVEFHPVEFLRACLAEDEQMARAATQGACEGRWWAVEDRHYDDGLIRLVKTQAPFEDPDPTYWLPADHVVYAPEMGPEPEDEANLRHIARHDPAQVLTDVETKRQILDEHAPIQVEPGVTCCSRCLVWHDDPTNLRGVNPQLGRVGVAAPQPYPCRTVLLLVEGYRHRPGWLEEWKAP